MIADLAAKSGISKFISASENFLSAKKNHFVQMPQKLLCKIYMDQLIFVVHKEVCL